MVRRHACKRAYRFRSTRHPSRNNCSGARSLPPKGLQSRVGSPFRRMDGGYRSVTYVQIVPCSPNGRKTAEYSYMNEVSCVPLQQALRHLQTAFSNFFKQTGYSSEIQVKSHGGSAEYLKRVQMGRQTQ